MSTTIFNEHGKAVGTGRNLGIMLRQAAKRGGVKSVVINRTGRPFPNYEATVTVTYADRARAVTDFVSYDHAVEWATTRSKANPRVSWFAGCTVEAI